MRGISANIKANKKPKKTGDDFIDELNLKDFKRNRKIWLYTLEKLLNPIRLLKFVEDNSKKVTIKFDKRDVVGFIQLAINECYMNDKIATELKKMLK